MPPAVDDSMLAQTGAPPAPPTGPSSKSVASQHLLTRVGAGRWRTAEGPRSEASLEVSARGTGQTVAVIDTGVARHRLLPHLVPGGRLRVARGRYGDDCDGHGTVVGRGIIGADSDSDGSTFSGMRSRDATIVRAFVNRATNSRAAGRSVRTELASEMWIRLAGAVRTAADMGATVINVSSVAWPACASWWIGLTVAWRRRAGLRR